MRKRLRRFLIGGLLLVVVLALAAPRLLRWRLAASEICAPQYLEHIASAVEAYASERGTPPPNLGSLSGRVAPELACDAPSCDYRRCRFRYTALPANQGRAHYALSAQPLMESGRSFYLDETGILRSTSENRAATGSDPPMKDIR